MVTWGPEPGNLYFQTCTCAPCFSMSHEWNAHQTQSITLHWANSDVISICVLNPTTHQREAQNPQNNQNVGFIQMMPQWKPTAAQLLNRFLRRWNVLSTTGAADIYTSATPSTSPCCAQIQQPPSAFGRGYSGCTPPGRSSTQVNLFVEPGKTPVNHLYSSGSVSLGARFSVLQNQTFSEALMIHTCCTWALDLIVEFKCFINKPQLLIVTLLSQLLAWF